MAVSCPPEQRKKGYGVRLMGYPVQQRVDSEGIIDNAEHL